MTIAVSALLLAFPQAVHAKDPAADVAKTWLRAFAARDTSTLAKLTGVPFVARIKQSHDCEDGRLIPEWRLTATSAPALAEVFKAMLAQTALSSTITWAVAQPLRRKYKDHYSSAPPTPSPPPAYVADRVLIADEAGEDSNTTLVIALRGGLVVAVEDESGAATCGD